MLDQIHQAVHRRGQAEEVIGRGKRLKETPELFSGLFWTGQQAVAWAWPTSWATSTTSRAK
jgi:protease-4